MSMSTHVIGFVPPDDKWKQMKAVWDACETAGIEVPDEVDAFFGGEPPDSRGVEVGLPVRPWNEGMSKGFELDVASIPKDVKVIRFYNSW